MIHIGSSYYPPHHPQEEWAKDFANMADSGHTAVRIAELLASWDLLELHPRKPDFSSVDAAFELAAKHGMKVLLGTGSCCPPGWLREENDDLNIVDRDGRPYPAGAMWNWACINHPQFLFEADRYLRQLLERYGNHPALLGWQINNEPGFPFIPREGEAAPPWYDYNRHTVAAFREWLAERYGNDIDALHEAWLWIPSNARARTFEEIEAPRYTGAEWGCPKAWLDWRRFTCDNWDAFIKRQHDLIKSRTPDRPTMTNLFGAATDLSGRLGVDSWTLPRQCDAIGFDMYPGMRMPTAASTGRPFSGMHSHADWFLDFAMSVAKHNGKPLWLPEMESGPLAGWAKGPQYPTSAADIRRWGLLGLSRGAQMILYQGYRDWRSLPMHWGGLADWEGEPTERLEAARQLAELVERHKDLFEEAVPRPARIALLYSHDNVLYNAATGSQDYAELAMGRMYDKLWRLGYAVEFVDPDHAGPDMDYRVVIAPFQTMLAQATAEALHKYVAGGGILITMPRTGMVDENCKVWPRRPGGLEKMLGVRETGIEVADDIELTTKNIVLDKLSFSGFHHKQRLEITDIDARVLATFADGDPAVVCNLYGEGFAVHCATHLDLAPADDAGLEFWNRLLVRKLELHPDVFIKGEGQPLAGRIMEVADRGWLLFVTNSGDKAFAGSVFVGEVEAKSVKPLWETGSVSVAANGSGHCELHVSLPPKEGLVALLER